MITYYANARPKIRQFLIELLRDDPYLKLLIGGRVYPRHLSTIENPVFPCVTIVQEDGSTDPGIVQIGIISLSIDVWSKKGVVELWKVYANQDSNSRPAGVFGLLANKEFDLTEAIVERCVEVASRDDLFEPWSSTWRLASRFKIWFSAKNLVA